MITRFMSQQQNSNFNFDHALQSIENYQKKEKLYEKYTSRFCVTLFGQYVRFDVGVPLDTGASTSFYKLEMAISQALKWQTPNTEI